MDPRRRSYRVRLPVHGIARGLAAGLRFHPGLRKRARQSDGPEPLVLMPTANRLQPSDSPIGLFDSGIGGLTVLQQIHEKLPRENTVYLGDTARSPYGTKSVETVLRYSFENADFLLQKGVKAVVVACNTSTAVALGALKDELSV